MTEARVSVQDFSLANPIYIGARVTFWTVDGTGAKTTTAATLYSTATGSTTLANPQTLDGEGKFSAPVYINGPVVATVSGRNVASHDTGVIGTVFVTGVTLAGGTAGQIPINSGTAPVWRTMSGDITISPTGVTTLAAKAASDFTNGTTGTGHIVLDNTPVLITPVLGVATAISINGLTISTTTGTITLANGKTLVVNNGIALAGTDGRTYTFPANSGSVLTADSTNTLTNKTFDSAGAGNSLKINGITVSRGQFPGTNSNDAATAGNIGELIASTSPNPGNATVTVTIASPAVVSFANHGIVGVCAVLFTTTGALPTGLTASTVYYTCADTNLGGTFKVATSIANALANTAVNTSGSQSGTHTGTQVIPLTTAVAKDLAAVQLTAGDWDIDGGSYILAAASTVVMTQYVSISTTLTTCDFSTGNFGGGAPSAAGATGPATVISMPNRRVSIAVPTIYYLVVQTSFTTSTLTANGAFLRARRVR